MDGQSLLPAASIFCSSIQIQTTFCLWCRWAFVGISVFSLHWPKSSLPLSHNNEPYRLLSIQVCCESLLLLQELVGDAAIATSSRHADLSWARRFAVASPRLIGRRSASTVLSQDCLGRPALRLQSPGESIMQASRAWWWSCQGSARRRCPKNDRRRLRTVSDRSGCPVRAVPSVNHYHNN